VAELPAMSGSFSGLRPLQDDGEERAPQGDGEKGAPQGDGGLWRTSGWREIVERLRVTGKRRPSKVTRLR